MMMMMSYKRYIIDFTVVYQKQKNDEHRLFRPSLPLYIFLYILNARCYRYCVILLLIMNFCFRQCLKLEYR